jgi:hypothetical protein
MNKAHLAATLPESHVMAHAIQDVLIAVRQGTVQPSGGAVSVNGCRIPTAGVGFFCDLARLKYLRGGGLPDPDLDEALFHGVVHPRILDMGLSFVHDLERLNSPSLYNSYGSLSPYGKRVCTSIIQAYPGLPAAAQIIGLTPL